MKLQSLMNRGENKARVLTRARMLLLSERGKTIVQIVDVLGVAPDTVQRTRTRYREGGLEAVLLDKPRSGRPKKITEQEIQRIVALVCSHPPEGYARWSIGLLTKEAMARQLVNAIGESTVGHILRDHRLKPWREKNVVRSKTERGISGVDDHQI